MHEALAPPPSDTDEEEDPACCVLCGERLEDATCSEHVARCFDEHLPIDPPPPPSKRQRLSDAAERTGSGQPLFGERMPYLPRELGILAIDQPVFSVADLISMLRVSRVRPTPVGHSREVGHRPPCSCSCGGTASTRSCANDTRRSWRASNR